MDSLAQQFLEAINSPPSQPNLTLIFDVFKSGLPIPRPIFVSALCRLAVTIRRAPNFSDAVINDLLSTIEIIPDLPIYTTENTRIEPWLTITLEALTLRVKISSAESRRQAWKLLLVLGKLVSEPVLAYECFPGLFKAALGEIRSAVNQEVGCSGASLSAAVELAVWLVHIVLPDNAVYPQAADARKNVISAMNNLLNALNSCIQNPVVRSNSDVLLRISNLLQEIILTCPSLLPQITSNFLDLLISTHSLTHTCFPQLPITILSSISRQLTEKLDSIRTSSQSETDYRAILSLWELLNTDQDFFISCNSALIISALKAMSAFTIPKIVGVKLSEDALEEFSSLPSQLKPLRGLFFSEMKRNEYMKLELMDELQKQNDFWEYHKTAFCAFLMEIEPAFLVIFSNLQRANWTSMAVNQQEMSRIFLKSGLLKLLDRLEISPFERIFSLIQLWEESIDSLISDRFLALATSENADLKLLLAHYSEKITGVVSSVLHNLPQGSQVITAYLRFFGAKEMRKIVFALLGEVDKQVGKVRGGEAAGVVKGLAQAMMYYEEAVKAGFVEDGNLGRAVLMRLKPLLAWKREKGRNLLAFEILKLFISLVPVLDSLPLSIENESTDLFAIHEESNVRIPKALPALLHEYFPSLVRLSQVLVQSQDYACLTKVFVLLTETNRLNPGFMDRREEEMKQVLVECMREPGQSMYRRAAWEAARALVGCLRPESPLHCLTK